MQLYPHWLDGEFVRIASNATGPEQNVQEMIRALKLHALLGTQFVLNDVQIFDSAAVLALFADPDARAMLRSDRSFLDLRVEPDKALGKSSFALAARGLTRTRTPGWISSVFMNDPTPIKRLADEIIEEVLSQNYINLERPSSTVQAYSQYATQLNAVRQAVQYFGLYDAPHKLIAVPGERINYYQVLCNSFDKLCKYADELQLPEVPEKQRPVYLAQVQEDLTHLEETLNFINKKIEDPDKRKARSRVLAILNHEADRAKRERIWNNVVQAWNYATQKTIQPDGGSVGTLPSAVSPAPYLDSTTDILVPVDVTKLAGPMAGIPSVPRLPIDIDAIEWKQIAKVRAKTEDTMVQLTLARRIGSIDAVSQPLRKHLDAVGRILEVPKKVSKVTYVFKITNIATSVAAVVAAFGGPDADKYIKPIATSIAAANTIGSVICDSTETWRQRRALTTTLNNAATGQPK